MGRPRYNSTLTIERNEALHVTTTPDGIRLTIATSPGVTATKSAFSELALFAKDLQSRLRSEQKIDEKRIALEHRIFAGIKQSNYQRLTKGHRHG